MTKNKLVIEKKNITYIVHANRILEKSELVFVIHNYVSRLTRSKKPKSGDVVEFKYLG